MLLELFLNHLKCEAPDAAKKEIRLTEVTQRTFDAAVPWVKFFGIFNYGT